MSFLSIPNPLRASTRVLYLAFADFCTASSVAPDSSIPKETLAISGTTLTSPVPSTTRGAHLSWENTEKGIVGPNLEYTNKKTKKTAIKKGCLRSLSLSIEVYYSKKRGHSLDLHPKSALSTSSYFAERPAACTSHILNLDLECSVGIWL